MFGKKKIDKNIKKLLKQYGFGSVTDDFVRFNGGRVDIYPIECWKRYRKDNNHPTTIHPTLEKAIELVKNNPRRFFDCCLYLPTELVDYIQSEVGEEKADLKRDRFVFGIIPSRTF